MGVFVPRLIALILSVMCVSCAQTDAFEGPAPQPLEGVLEREDAVETMRSPDEFQDPGEREPIRVSGAFVAGMHQEAIRLRGGHGTEADPARAAQLFERACEAGFLASCLALSDMLSEGEGVTRDLERAHALVQQACYAGSRVACDQLGH